AGEALVEAVGTSEGPLQQAIVAGLGVRREAAAVAPLLALLKGADKPLAATTATALAEIGDPRAAEALVSRDGVAASALLKLASRLAEEGHPLEAERVYAHLDRDAPDH